MMRGEARAWRYERHVRGCRHDLLLRLPHAARFRYWCSMLDGVLTIIAATDREMAIENAVAAMRHELLSRGARVGEPDWLAPAQSL